MMRPLRVVATLQDAVSLRMGALALDALLASLYAMVRHLPAVVPGAAVEPLPIPLAREPGGRFDLASFSVTRFDAYSTTHEHKSFPQSFAKRHTQMRRVDITSGVNKSCRNPLAMAYPEANAMTWWCVGDLDGIEELLQYCHHLGHKRAHGLGKVRRWEAAPCEPWGDGFPCVLNGKPLRPLPPDWPGLVEPELRTTRLTYPYWPTAPGQQLCAVPELEE